MIRTQVSFLIEKYEDMRIDRTDWRAECKQLRKEKENQYSIEDVGETIMSELGSRLIEKINQQGEHIKSILKDQAKELESLKQTLKNQLKQIEQRRLKQNNNEQSYAQILTRPLPKPAIFVKTKDTDTPIQAIRNTLNKEVNTSVLTKLSCRQTKAGNLIVTCNTDKDLNDLQQQLEK